MSIVRWTPARDLAPFPSDVLNIQREINRMFNTFFRNEPGDDSLANAGWNPAVDIAEHDDAFVVKVELPGVAKDEVKIVSQENMLTIRGEKKQEKESKGSNFHRVERSYGVFQRSFTLPSTVKGEKIEATFKDGVLTVTLPKAEEAKRKEVEVKVK
jgi:HSP20 family protein